MSNMSYCRFENTFGDLCDCQEALDDLVDNGGVNEYDEILSNYELPKAIELIELCCQIAEQKEELLEMLNEMKEGKKYADQSL